jgi:hypothetical protein
MPHRTGFCLLPEEPPLFELHGKVVITPDIFPVVTRSRGIRSSLTTLARSAPTKPGVRAAMADRSTVGASVVRRLALTDLRHLRRRAMDV